MKLSILVPFRDADGTRTQGWSWIRRRWAHYWPEAEIVEASDDGVDPFCKSMAVNNAAKQATGDVFVILDADTWIDPRWMHKALDWLGRKSWVIPASRAMRLTELFSLKLMTEIEPAGGELPPISTAWSKGQTEIYSPVVGFLWVMPRAGFEAVGGMDERIRGWGGEDTSFTRAMDVIWGAESGKGAHMKLPGTVMCLWHERPRDRVGRTWRGQDRTKEADKHRLMHRYSQARTPAAMRELLGVEAPA